MISMVTSVKTPTQGFNELVKLANRYNVLVEPGDEDVVIFKNDIPEKILYNNKRRITSRMWIVAHELGHVFVSFNKTNEVNTRITNSRQNSFWRKEEEFQAWVCADTLITQLNPAFYNDKYIKFKHEQLESYYNK